MQVDVYHLADRNWWTCAVKMEWILVGTALAILFMLVIAMIACKCKCTSANRQIRRGYERGEYRNERDEFDFTPGRRTRVATREEANISTPTGQQRQQRQQQNEIIEEDERRRLLGESAQPQPSTWVRKTL